MGKGERKRYVYICMYIKDNIDNSGIINISDRERVKRRRVRVVILVILPTLVRLVRERIVTLARGREENEGKSNRDIGSTARLVILAILVILGILVREREEGRKTNHTILCY
jgi:hypothetical protein